MLITVTEEDIAKGKKASALQCPVARALCRTFSRCVPDPAISVGPNIASIPGNFKSVLPMEAVAFIHRFHMGEPVQPFSFELPT